MKLLLLGGTRFLGRHVAEMALERGHSLTLLHRGRSASGLFAAAQHLIADRDGDLGVLDRGEWDAVIDTSAYRPRQVHAVADRIAGRIGHYTLVSTISVYRDIGSEPLVETAPLAQPPDPDAEAVDAASYGGLKALCEAAAQQRFVGSTGSALLVVRPGLIVGPHDPTGRFTWWVTRMQRGGEVLAPGDPASPVQFIDARDLAGWMLDAAERRLQGTFNATGPDAPLTMGGFFDALRATLAPPGTTLRWADSAWLLAQGVAPWTGLPLWLPDALLGMHRADCSRAREAGLRCRALAETLADTARWASGPVAQAAPPDGPARPPVGIDAATEQRLLALLR